MSRAIFFSQKHDTNPLRSLMLTLQKVGIKVTGINDDSTHLTWRFNITMDCDLTDENIGEIKKNLPQHIREDMGIIPTETYTKKQEILHR